MRTILDQYEGPLTRYAARITGDVELARDVVQETFLRLCGQDAAQVDGHLAQWLYTVCRNRAVDARRKKSPAQGLSNAAAEPRERADREPAAVVEGRELAGRVREMLTLLPENQQEVVRLRFQSGLSYKEIAAVTGLSVTNVGYLIHTGIKRIRAKLDGDVMDRPK